MRIGNEKAALVGAMIIGVALTGCNQQELSEQEAKAIGSQMASSVEDQAQSFDLSGDETDTNRIAARAPGLPRPFRRVLRRFQRRPNAASGIPCVSGTVAFEGNPDRDTDADGIVDAFKISFTDCLVEPEENRDGAERVESILLNGALSIKDDAPEAPKFAFTLVSDELTAEIEGEGGAHGTLMQDATVIGTEADGTYGLSLVGLQSAEVKGPRDGEHSFSAQLDWNTTYAPSEAWIPGQPMVKGTVGIVGSYDVTYDDKSAAATLETLPTVDVDPACESDSHIVAGSAQASWKGPEGEAELKAVWSSCENVEIEFKGTRYDAE